MRKRSTCPFHRILRVCICVYIYIYIYIESIPSCAKVYSDAKAVHKDRVYPNNFLIQQPIHNTLCVRIHSPIHTAVIRTHTHHHTLTHSHFYIYLYTHEYMFERSVRKILRWWALLALADFPRNSHGCCGLCVQKYKRTRTGIHVHSCKQTPPSKQCGHADHNEWGEPTRSKSQWRRTNVEGIKQFQLKWCSWLTRRTYMYS